MIFKYFPFIWRSETALWNFSFDPMASNFLTDFDFPKKREENNFNFIDDDKDKDYFNDDDDFLKDGDDDDLDLEDDDNLEEGDNFDDTDDQKDFPPSFFSEDSLEPDSFNDRDLGSYLERYGTDLTRLAAEGQLNECFGRDAELVSVMEILVRRQKNNPVLIGDAGVGKTAIVELFATKLVRNLVPFVLQGRRIVSIDLSRIIGGSRYRGEFELRFRRILDEVIEQPQIILFIDEIHNISGAGSAEGSLDAANILKPVLSRSGFQCIGATTTKEYERLEKDPALNRRFQSIKVNEPTTDQTLAILYYLRPIFETYHNVEITEEAIISAVNLSQRYIYDRFLPDKAIDLIDRACAKEVIRMTSSQFDSILSSLVNTSLVHIGRLKAEAFRKGDIALEFVFQEIENAYRNFLLRWIHEPEFVPNLNLPSVSPTHGGLSEELFDSMRIAMLENVKDLLFTSIRPDSDFPIYHTRAIFPIDELSMEKIADIFQNIQCFISTEIMPNDSDISLSRYQILLAGIYSLFEDLDDKSLKNFQHFIEEFEEVEPSEEISSFDSGELQNFANLDLENLEELGKIENLPDLDLEDLEEYRRMKKICPKQITFYNEALEKYSGLWNCLCEVNEESDEEWKEDELNEEWKEDELNEEWEEDELNEEWEQEEWEEDELNGEQEEDEWEEDELNEEWKEDELNGEQEEDEWKEDELNEEWEQEEEEVAYDESNEERELGESEEKESNEEWVDNDSFFFDDEESNKISYDSIYDSININFDEASLANLEWDDDDLDEYQEYEENTYELTNIMYREERPFFDVIDTISISRGNEAPSVLLEHTIESEVQKYFYKRICHVRKLLTKTSSRYMKEFDFCQKDIDANQKPGITERFLSELEVHRWTVFRRYLSELRPLVEETFLDGLFQTSESSLDLSSEDKKHIYDLLGYFSTSKGHQDLIRHDDPDLIRRARSMGEMQFLKARVTEEKLLNVLSVITGIPLDTLTTQESEKLLALETTLHQRVIGQERAISVISKAIRRARLGIQNPNRPLASFMFCGPTGVGKTEVTKALAEALFGSENNLIRFDMSEFMDKFTISRLIGSPPGYIGYEEGGQLTDMVRNKPYSVVLFDEIEKAHPEVLNLLLQILEDGRLTDTQKRLVKFTNTLVIMTSNAGSEDILNFVNTPQFKQCNQEIEKIEQRILDRKKNRLQKIEERAQTGKGDQKGYVIKKRKFVRKDKRKGYLSDRPYRKMPARYKHGIYYHFLEEPIRADFLENIRARVAESLNGSFKTEIESDYDSFLKLIDSDAIFKNEEETVDTILENKEESNEEEKNTKAKLEKEEAEQERLIRKEEEERESNLKERNKLDAELKKVVISSLTTFFLPEFLNRLDDIIVFQPLTPEELVQICDIMIKTVAKRVLDKGIIVQAGSAVRRHLAYSSYDPAYGARPLRRSITRNIEDKIVDNLLEHPLSTGQRKLNFVLNSANAVVVEWDSENSNEKKEEKSKEKKFQREKTDVAA